MPAVMALLACIGCGTGHPDPSDALGSNATEMGDSDIRRDLGMPSADGRDVDQPDQARSPITGDASVPLDSRAVDGDIPGAPCAIADSGNDVDGDGWRDGFDNDCDGIVDEGCRCP